MLPYYFLIFVPFFLEAVEKMLQSNRGYVFNAKSSNSSIVVFFVILFAMLSLRSISCGIDLRNYQYTFSWIAKLNFSECLKNNTVEPLYVILNWVVARIYCDFRLFLVVVALMCTGITGWFYWRESKCAPLTILLFVINPCFFMFYSGLRQALAMLFVIPAYYMILRKKLIPFIILVIIASYFHTSAIIMCFLYSIFYMPLKSKHFIFVLVLVFTVFLFKSQLFFMVLPFLANKYADLYGQITETNSYTMWIFFLFLLSYAFCVIDEEKMSIKQKGFRNTLVVMTIIQGFAPIHSIAMRFNLYFIMLLPVIIPELITTPKKGNENFAQLFKWFTISFLVFFFFYRAEPGGGLNAIPYKAFWE